MPVDELVSSFRLRVAFQCCKVSFSALFRGAGFNARGVLADAGSFMVASAFAAGSVMACGTNASMNLQPSAPVDSNARFGDDLVVQPTC